MRKLFLTFAILLVAVISSDARNVSKRFNNSGFVGLEVNDAFSVELVKADKYRVEIEVPEDYMEFVSVEQSGGKLTIGFKNLPRKMKSFKSLKGFNARISMPEIYLIELNGASKLDCTDTFESEMRRVDVSVTGGSKISSFVVNAPMMDVNLSGSSKVEMKVKASEIKVNVGGASKFDIEGETSDLNMEVSGASSVSAEKLRTNYVKLDVGGASRADVFVGGQFIVEVSGASKCVYYTEGPINLDVTGVTGASTLKKADSDKDK